MTVQTIVSPSGDELVVMSRQEYQDLLDARDHAASMREVAVAADTLTDAELGEYLAAPTALAFWRKRRGSSRTDLAAQLRIAEADLAAIEEGLRVEDITIYARLAALLGIRIEDLIEQS